MNFRLFAIAIATSSISVCGAHAGESSHTQSTGDQPNIVIVLVDDLGYGDLGSYGATRFTTPTIDGLAKDGVRFTDFYASGNVCTPSRAGLLIGKYPIRVGLADKTISEQDTRGIPAGEQTIAEVFAANGYRTALIGKWHLGHATPELMPLGQGFDYFYGLRRSNDAEDLFYIRDNTRLKDPVVQEELTERWTKEAIRYIEDDDDRPFFLLLSHTAPHKPIRPSAKFKTKSGVGPYADLVQEIDDSTAQVIAALRRTGADANTIVVFTSDNGPFPQGSAGELRGGKGTSWDGGYRVPMIIRWPSGIDGGKTVSGISMNIDLLPSLAELAGIELSGALDLDGRSFVPMLNGVEESPHEALLFFHDEQVAAVRTQKWKAVFQSRYRGIKRWLPDHDVRLLFDMTTDPGETYSMADERPDIWQEMNQRLERVQKELQVPVHYKD